MDNLTFVRRFEAILDDRAIPKSVFYKDCNISDGAVSQWRTGKTSPSNRSINRIADYLGVTPEYLITGLASENAQKNPPAISGEGKDPLDARLDELLANADDDLKRLMVSFLERSQNK